MNVSLTPELEQYVNGKVQSGLYHSASEVVREGLRLLKEKDEVHQKKLQELRRDIQVGIDQAERGAAFAVQRADARGDQGRRTQAAGGRTEVEEPMKEPELTDQAKDDLRDIWYTISKAETIGPPTAWSPRSSISATTTPVPEVGSDSERSSSVGPAELRMSPYIVFYRPFEDRIMVLRILHGRRELKRIVFDD